MQNRLLAECQPHARGREDSGHGDGADASRTDSIFLKPSQQEIEGERRPTHAGASARALQRDSRSTITVPQSVSSTLPMA